jgi:flagellin-like hook-associated protein FlgL
MSNGIVLSNAIRTNLLTLQSTAEMQAKVQERLATGKKVNSALDNANNYFTALGFNSRANDLSRLLDGIGNGVQTIKAANTGLESIRKLVENAQATARQAMSAAKGTVNYTNSFAGTGVIAADVAATTGLGTTAIANTRATGTVGGVAGTDVLTGDLTVAAGETLTITRNGVTETILFDTAGNGGDLDPATATVNDLMTEIESRFGGSLLNASVTAGNNLQIEGDLLTSFTIGGTGAAKLMGATAASTAPTLSANQTFSVQVGTGAVQTITFGTAVGQADTLAELTAQLTALSGVTATINGTGNLTVTALDATQNLTLSGSARAELLGTVVSETAPANIFRPTNTSFTAIAGQKFTVGLSDGTTREMTFGSATGQIANRTDLLNAIREINPGLTPSFTAGNVLRIDSTNQYEVVIGGDSGVLSTLGLAAMSHAPTASVTTTNATRASLQKDYNDLLKQIDQLARDAGFNGINLLGGDSLKVTFNESETTFLTLQGVTYDSEGLGLEQIVSGDGFQVDANIQATLTLLDGARTRIQAQATKLGSNMSVIQTRQEFTKQMIVTLNVGADNLTVADTNEEGANLLALNTRQQLSQTALSLASQASQAVLRLFG